MTADIEQVRRLQSLDIQIAQLDREISTLPKHVSQIEKTLDGHLRRLEADRAALAANQKDRKRFEDDIKVHEQKISKLKDQTLQAKTNEQYRAFQNEIDYAQREIRKCEDGILELMSQSEPLDQAVKAAEVELKKEQVEVNAEKAKAEQGAAVHRQRLAELKAERDQIVAQASPSIYATYERIRKKRNGIAIAEVSEGRCSACMIALRPQFVQDLRKGEEMMICESCGRMLYYNPPVSFEADLAGQTR